MFDKYYLKARLAPTILTAFPLIAVYNFVVSPYIAEYLKAIIPLLPTVADLTLSLAIILFLVQVNRQISKELLEKPFFKSESKFPTTDFLLFSNQEYSFESKQKIRQKIIDYFGLTIPSQQEELIDEQRSRLLIREAVSQIRELLRGNEMLGNHNTEYGGARNFLGGCGQASAFSIILIIAATWLKLGAGVIILGTTFFVFYITFLLLGKKIITVYGNNYARILYNQFLFHTK
jgi:hypothetical protein